MVRKQAMRTRTSPERWRTRWNGKLLAFDMARAGLTQVALATKAGVTQVTVSRVLRGESVGVMQVAKVAAALGQPVERYVEDVIWERPA